jgi:hypothetical protein
MQLNANTPVTGTFSYLPAAGTELAAGSQTPSVPFTPTDTTDYTTSMARVTLTVMQATPTVTWSTPAAIISGSALSAPQFDATASLPGAFVFNPAPERHPRLEMTPCLSPCLGCVLVHRIRSG